MKSNRREFVKIIVGGVAGTAAMRLTGCASAAVQSAAGPASPWDQVPAILARIRPPTFPARDFVVTSYGAVGDGAKDCTTAFRQAIAACSAAGGGRVVVPAGRFMSGPIHLESNVNLHVGQGATIAFYTDPQRFLPQVFTRWEGMELMNYSPCVYAFEKENVAVTGTGTLDGQGKNENWWHWKDRAEYGWQAGQPSQIEARARLYEMVDKGVPVAQRVFGTGDYLRPQMLQPYRCRNVLLEDITILGSPMWVVHPVLCTNVTVRRVTVNSHGPNNDGCDPESCRDVLIEDCTFDTGDDCIAIKSGRNNDGRRVGVPTENVIIRGCHMKDGHGGVTVGSEISGGVRNVFAERCQMDSPHLDRAVRLKNNALRGGVLEHIYVRDLTVGELAGSVVEVDFQYEEGPNGPHTPIARDIEVRGVTSRKSMYGVSLLGIPKGPISDVRLIDCTFDGVTKGNRVENAHDLAFRNVHINGREIKRVADLTG